MDHIDKAGNTFSGSLSPAIDVASTGSALWGRGGRESGVPPISEGTPGNAFLAVRSRQVIASEVVLS